ncbi:MAG: ABC transporter substrate-binding protein [Promethearchaeota archaeon]
MCGDGFPGGNYNYKGGTVTGSIPEEWVPNGLFTDWVVEYWPEEENSLGWNNTGGVKSIEFTLREGTKFHDGSDWNATVAKWNVDRFYIITGNLSGIGDIRHMDGFYPEVAKTEKFWTSSWNLSAFDDQVAGYYVGPGVDYPGVNEVGGWVYNPKPFNSDFTVAYAPYDRVPDIYWVEITESKKSGGKIKVYWNGWNTLASDGLPYGNCWSYKAYAENYTAQAIYGNENGVKHPKNPTIIDHMIGTGPYKYVESNEDGGIMVKFEDYWNKTALEAEGLFDIERVEIINFPQSEAGALAANNALLSHAVDMAIDGSGVMSLDTESIKSNTKINYWPQAPNTYPFEITMNAINETYWAWPWMKSTAIDYIDQGDINGLPQALRKALSYAYDYDFEIDVVIEGKAVREPGIVGSANLYYNESVPVAEFDVEYAREVLLTTEEDTSGKVFTVMNALNGYVPNPDLYNFSKRCADRGLTASSTDAEWQAVAESGDPVWTVDFYWGADTETSKDEFLKAATRLGIALTDPTGVTNRVPQRMWDVIQLYWAQTFPTGKSIWSVGAWPMPYNMPIGDTANFLQYKYRDPSEGLWRTLGSAGIASDYWPRWNFGFMYDDRINDWLDRIFYSTPDQKKGWISKMADVLQNERYPFIYTFEPTGGNCQWDCWESKLYLQERTGIQTGYWGLAGAVYSYSSINYKGCPEDAPLISGYSLLMTITVSAISILGISYIIMRRKKLR